MNSLRTIATVLGLACIISPAQAATVFDIDGQFADLGPFSGTLQVEDDGSVGVDLEVGEAVAKTTMFDSVVVDEIPGFQSLTLGSPTDPKLYFHFTHSAPSTLSAETAADEIKALLTNSQSATLLLDDAVLGTSTADVQVSVSEPATTTSSAVALVLTALPWIRRHGIRTARKCNL